MLEPAFYGPHDAHDAEGARFAEWLAGQMEARGWTQERAAREIQVSLSAVRSWLSGKVQPGYRQLWKVDRVFGKLPFK
jgi:transcriptional regulator with XRE-family HTH domain